MMVKYYGKKESAITFDTEAKTYTNCSFYDPSAVLLEVRLKSDLGRLRTELEKENYRHVSSMLEEVY